MNRRRHRAAAIHVTADLAQRPLTDRQLVDLAERCERISEAMLRDADRVRSSRRPECAGALEAVAASVAKLARGLVPPPDGEMR
jgi:hypothetical protein